MTQQIHCANARADKAMSSEQFNQIVEAILAGKYSWACVLLLRFAGYNPLHYIPYRTYNRLQKENCQYGRPNQGSVDTINTIHSGAATKSAAVSSHQGLSKITDLAYLEPASQKNAQVRGGHLAQWLSGVNPEKILLSSQGYSIFK